MYKMNLTGKYKIPPRHTVMSTYRTVTKVIAISDSIMRKFSTILTEGKGSMERSTICWKLLTGALNRTVEKQYSQTTEVFLSLWK